jgi:phage/plasmid-associated DNA primase
MGDWSKLKEHIKNNICQRKPEVYDYVLMWLAFAVQHPNRPSEVALAMRGKRGVGKSILGNIFGKLFGQHFRHIFSSKHLVGHFNSHLRDCIFLFADEAFWTGEKSAEGVLKGLITEPTLNIEGKGKDIVRTKNMLHIMMASNSDWVVPAGLEERRFCILDVGDKHIQDKAYFGAIYKQMENGGYAAMLHDLLDLDLRDFDIRDVPDTEGLREQKILSMDPITAWWFQKLKDGSLPSEDGEWGITEKNAIYEDYAETIGKAGVIYKGMQTSLGMKLKKLLPGPYPKSKKKQVEEKEDYNADRDLIIKTGERIPHWQFPPLKECREFFEQLAKLEGYNWPEEPEFVTEEEKPDF